MKKVIFLLLIIVLFSKNIFAQGLQLDPEKYKTYQVWEEEEFGFADYIPTKYSLRKYCPAPVQQEGNSCVGLVLGYMALTIMYSEQFNVKYSNELFATSFDPYYIYALLRQRTDFHCDKGIRMGDALELLRDVGCKRWIAPPLLNCESEINETSFKETFVYANPFKIKNAYRIKNVDETYIKILKKVIANRYPLPIGMYVPNSMLGVSQGGAISSNGLWKPDADEKIFGGMGHAMCIIGYDDYKFGGSFEIMNSWGSDYGDNGFIWIKYEDFNKYVSEIYIIELYGFSSSSCVFGDCNNKYSRYKFDNAEIYEGEFLNMQFHGFGYYIWTDGQVYGGFYKYGKRNGLGFLFSTNGKVYLCKYENDKLIDYESFGFAEIEDDPETKKFESVYNFLKEKREILDANSSNTDLGNTPEIKE
ncbi:MAG: hypothetical protein IIA88_10450 [Bacteroidetes bacterium]|nr:hypothetical protein [Bacteroidota bacterium]